MISSSLSCLALQFVFLLLPYILFLFLILFPIQCISFLTFDSTLSKNYFLWLMNYFRFLNSKAGFAFLLIQLHCIHFHHLGMDFYLWVFDTGSYLMKIFYMDSLFLIALRTKGRLYFLLIYRI